jgi:redox-sensitive bicupin YhaK (pirin superfamily)
LLRLIAGDLDGHRGPGQTHTPISYLHATIPAGGRIDLPWDPAFNAMVYALSGRGTAGTERAPFGEGRLVQFGPGDHLVVEADPRQDSRTPDLEVLILGGRPIREPIAHYGPFVMNTKAEVIQALDDFQAGRMGQIPVEHLGHS